MIVGQVSVVRATVPVKQRFCNAFNAGAACSMDIHADIRGLTLPSTIQRPSRVMFRQS